MPREVKAYACKYRCGHRVSTKKESIANHEKICFSNRESKACRTCALMLGLTTKGLHCRDGHLDENKYATYNCEHWKDMDDEA